MTLDEAKAKAKFLDKLNLDIWNTLDRTEKENLRQKFKRYWNEITSNGFKILRRKEYNLELGYKVPVYKIREDKSEQYVSIIDNRSANGYHKGDCTTRCISFCTGVDYDTIQREQFANARNHGGYGITWRTPVIWSQSLTSRGYVKITLPYHISGKRFLRNIKDCEINEGIIAALSANHLAAIDMKNKKILDTWNSAGCRIRSIYVPVIQQAKWEKIVRLNLYR